MSIAARLPSRIRRIGPSALPLYPIVLITVPGAISTLTGAIRRVKSGLAGGRAASDENRGTEARAAPTVLAPVTARNSRRFNICPPSRLLINWQGIALQAAIIQSSAQGVKLESCEQPAGRTRAEICSASVRFAGRVAGIRGRISLVQSPRYGVAHTTDSFAALAAGDRRLDRRAWVVPDRASGFFGSHFSSDK